MPLSVTEQTDDSKLIAIHLASLWPWPLTSDFENLFQQCPLTCWTFVLSFVQIPTVSEEVSRHVDLVLTDNRQTRDGRPAGWTTRKCDAGRLLLLVEAWKVRSRTALDLQQYSLLLLLLLYCHRTCFCSQTTRAIMMLRGANGALVPLTVHMPWDVGHSPDISTFVTTAGTWQKLTKAILTLNWYYYLR